jgi:hypothetical protein
MSVAPHVLSTTYHYAQCILTDCIIKMGVIKKFIVQAVGMEER